MRYNYIVLLFIITLYANNIYTQDLKSNQDSTKTNRITLEQAVGLALINNPDLKIFQFEILTLEKEKIQAGLIPNPELSFDAENILGSKDFKGFGGSELTLSLSKQFELGGKRGSRIELADQQISKNESEYKLLKLNVISSVKKAYFELYRIGHQLELQQKFIQVNDDILKTISDRLKAGKTSPAEESKVKIALINSKIEYDRLMRSLSSAQNKFSVLIGSEFKNYIPQTDLFENIPGKPNLEDIINNIGSFQSVVILEKERSLRKARLNLEESQAVPDIQLSGGVRYLNELNTNSFVAGASIPLPFFNKNQGNIQAAEIQLLQMDDIVKSKIFSISSFIKTVYNNLSSAYFNSVTLKEKIIPESENAYTITKQGYVQGRFAFIDLLDAQRTLFETQNQYLLELSDYYNSLIELENITGDNFVK